jgi:hypothetical protein
MKNYRELYRKFIESDLFKEVYKDKSLVETSIIE